MGRPGVSSQPCCGTERAASSADLSLVHLHWPPSPKWESMVTLRLPGSQGEAVMPAGLLLAQGSEVWQETRWRNISYSCVNYYYFYRYCRRECSPVKSLGKRL